MAPHSTRHILPKPGRDGDSGAIPPDAFKKRKRQAVAIACDRCRKRKIKCSGQRPHCRVCLDAAVECKYTTPEDHTTVERERSYKGLWDAFEALRRMDTYSCLEFVQSIRDNPDLDMPSRPRQAPCDPDHREQMALTDADYERLGKALENLTYPDDTSGRRGMMINRDLRPSKLPISSWTHVSSDDEMMTHLLTLFWTWDHMLTKVIHQEMFVNDLRAGCKADNARLGRSEFCSEFLVNAVLALSTVYSVRDLRSSTPGSLGRLFAAEALRLLASEEDNISLGVLQGTAALALYEYCSGNTLAATDLFNKTFLMHSAFDSSTDWTLKLYDTNDPRGKSANAALSFISWGFYFVGTKLSLVLDQPVRIKKPRQPLVDFDSIGLEEGKLYYPRHLWFPYPDLSSPRLSYDKEWLIAERDLAELMQETLQQSEPGQLFPVPDYKGAKDLCGRVLRCKRIHEDKLCDISSQVPARTFFSVSCCMLVMKILRPFRRLSFLDFDGGHSAASMCLFESNSIVSMLWNYSTAFGMKHEYWLLQACQGAASVILAVPQALAIQSDTFARACQLLCKMGEHLTQANQALFDLQAWVARDEIDVPQNALRYLAEGKARVTYQSFSSVRMVRETGDNKTVVANPGSITFGKVIKHIGEPVQESEGV